MAVFRSKFDLLPGTSFTEVMSAARREYHNAQKRTPRRIPNVRSKYFNKDKVLLNSFWDHLKQKNPTEQRKRLKFYACALDLIRNTTNSPQTIVSSGGSDNLFHRFYGKSKQGIGFYVQVKHNKRSGRKDFMSVFPETKQKASR